MNIMKTHLTGSPLLAFRPLHAAKWLAATIGSDLKPSARIAENIWTVGTFPFLPGIFTLRPEDSRAGDFPLIYVASHERNTIADGVFV